MKCLRLLAFWILCATVFSPLLYAEEEKKPSRADLPLDDLFSTKKAQVEVQADSLEYARGEKKVIAKNNVVITYQETQIASDYAEVETETKKAYARGHVVIFKHFVPRAQGHEIYYDFQQHSGSFPDGRMFNAPWYTRGMDIQQVREGVKVVKEGGFTSCDLKNPHYELRAKKVVIYDKDKLIARNVTLYVLGKPVFWWPFMIFPLQERSLPFSINTGHNSRHGYFIHVAKGFSIVEQVWGKAVADWRSKRGFGAGGSLSYQFGKKTYGDLSLYLTQDKEAPTPGSENPFSETERRERGRISWRHRTDIDPYSQVILRYNRLADEYFLQEFFEKEYRGEIEPNSFITLTKNAPRYGVLAHLQKRMNRFESVVESLPQIQLDWRNQPLGKGIYYESQLSYANLIKRFGRSERNANVSRMDNFHQWLRPFKWREFKWTPHANFRGTYYSRERESENDHFRLAYGLGFDLRTHYYKTFPTALDQWGLEVNQLRHVIEPYVQMNSTTSTVSDEKLDYFDSIDQVDDSNLITFGIENRIQTKRPVEGKMQRVDIVSMNTFLSYELHPDGRTQRSLFAPLEVGHTASGFSVLGQEVVLRPYSWLQYQLRFDFDARDTTFRMFNQDIVARGKKFRVIFGHRTLNDIPGQTGSNQFVFDSNYQINKLWGVGGYIRWDAKDRGLEEWQLSASRDLHDFILRFGYNVRDSLIDHRNRTLYFQFFLKAFPEIGISSGGGNASFEPPRVGETVSGSNQAYSASATAF